MTLRDTKKLRTGCAGFNHERFYASFFNRSRISVSSFTSSEGSGAGSSFFSSSFLRVILLKPFSTKNRVSAVIRKVMMAWMKFPYITEAPPTVRDRDVKSICPRIRPSRGVMMSWFKDVTMAVNAEAYDKTDCHAHHIALGNEFLEFTDQCFHDSSSYFVFQ